MTTPTEQEKDVSYIPQLYPEPKIDEDVFSYIRRVAEWAHSEMTIISARSIQGKPHDEERY